MQLRVSVTLRSTNMVLHKRLRINLRLSNFVLLTLRG